MSLYVFDLNYETVSLDPSDPSKFKVLVSHEFQSIDYSVDFRYFDEASGSYFTQTGAIPGSDCSRVPNSKSCLVGFKASTGEMIHSVVSPLNPIVAGSKSPNSSFVTSLIMQISKEDLKQSGQQKQQQSSDENCIFVIGAVDLNSGKIVEQTSGCIPGDEVNINKPNNIGISSGGTLAMVGDYRTFPNGHFNLIGVSSNGTVLFHQKDPFADELNALLNANTDSFLVQAILWP